MNTAPDAVACAERSPSLYEAVAALERHFGPALVHNPARWGTADGVIEYRATYGYAHLMRQQLAGERLHLSRAAAIARGGKDAANAAAADERVAHGVS